MKKINIVKKNIEFNNIINKGKKYSTDIFYVYVINNSLSYNRYGISVSKKVGNAVIRNKYKRRIKNIIDAANINFKGLDIIFISRPKLKYYNYDYIKNNIIKLISTIGDKNEK